MEGEKSKIKKTAKPRRPATGEPGLCSKVPPCRLGALAHQTKILGDIIAPVVDLEEWEVLRP